MKITFLFSGGRNEMLSSIIKGEAPDTSLIGANHVAQYLPGHTVEYVDEAAFWPTFMRLRRSDVIVSSVGLPLAFLQFLLLRKKPAWIFFNINMTTVLSNYPPRSVKRFFVLWTLKRMHTIACLSSAQRDYLLGLGVPSERLELVLFGADASYFRPSHEPGEYILSVGKDRARDYRTLITAARGIDARIVIVAPRKLIERESAGMLPENVEVRDDVDPAHVRPLFQKALFVVIPVRQEASKDGSDCSGQTVALEAFACGRAVVVSERAWTSDYVDDTCAITVQPGDPEALRTAMLELLHDPARQERMGRAGRERATSTYNTKHLGESLAQIISRIADVNI